VVRGKAMANRNWRCPNSADQSVIHRLRRGFSCHGGPTRFQPFRTGAPRVHPRWGRHHRKSPCRPWRTNLSLGHWHSGVVPDFAL